MVQVKRFKAIRSFQCKVLICMHVLTQPKYAQQRLTEVNGEMDKFIVRVGNFNTPPLVTYKVADKNSARWRRFQNVN